MALSHDVKYHGDSPMVLKTSAARAPSPLVTRISALPNTLYDQCDDATTDGAISFCVAPTVLCVSTK